MYIKCMKCYVTCGLVHANDQTRIKATFVSFFHFIYIYIFFYIYSSFFVFAAISSCIHIYVNTYIYA